MKKTYMKPEAEKITFSYREQVVASAGGGATCTQVWAGDGSLEDNCTITSSIPDSGF